MDIRKSKNIKSIHKKLPKSLQNKNIVKYY